MAITGDDINAMGYLGLQTKNSNTLDKISGEAKAALFDKFQNSNVGHIGSLYQFNDGSGETKARQNLYDSASKALSNPSISTIDQYANFIQAQTGTFNGIISQIAQASTVDEKKTRLLNGINNPDAIKDDYFQGYNKSAGTPSFELFNPVGGSSHFIPDSSGSNVGSRVTVMQLNQYDVR
jgi:hypothetical protein